MKYLLLLLIPAVIMTVVIRGKFVKFTRRGSGMRTWNILWLIVLILFIIAIYYFTFTWKP